MYLKAPNTAHCWRGTAKDTLASGRNTVDPLHAGPSNPFRPLSVKPDISTCSRPAAAIVWVCYRSLRFPFACGRTLIKAVCTVSWPVWGKKEVVRRQHKLAALIVDMKFALSTLHRSWNIDRNLSTCLVRMYREPLLHSCGPTMKLVNTFISDTRRIHGINDPSLKFEPRLI